MATGEGMQWDEYHFYIMGCGLTVCVYPGQMSDWGLFTPGLKAAEKCFIVGTRVFTLQALAQRLGCLDLFGGFCFSIWVEIALIRNVRTVYWSSKKKKKIQKYSLCCASHISLFGSQITVITESNVGQTGELLLCCDCGNYYPRHTRVYTTPLFQIEQQFWYNGHHYILTVDKPQVQILEFVDLIFTMLATFFVGFVAFDLP